MQTRKRHTPESMLSILNQIKDLCDKGKLVPKNLRPKTPCIYNVLFVLGNKAVITKKNKKYFLTGGQPNIYMAKEVIKENIKYQHQLLEKRLEREQNFQKYLQSRNSEMEIQSLKFDEIEHPNETEKFVAESRLEPTENIKTPIESSDKIRNKNKLLQEEINERKVELKQVKENFRSLLDDLVEYRNDNEELKEEVKIQQSTISSLEENNQRMFFENLQLKTEIDKIKDEKAKGFNQESYISANKDLEKQLAEYELDLSDLLKENADLNHQIDKMQQVQEEKKSIPRNVKLFGITILKIE
jgi:chromosome segregation ATPase